MPLPFASSAKRVLSLACLCLALLACMPALATAQLQITEIIFDTASSPESKWEWVEVRNSSDIPLDLNGYFFDDDDGNVFSPANIDNTQAMNTFIPEGGVGVLYNGSSLGFDDQRFSAAWNLGSNVPLVGVASPPALSNSGDAFGLWENELNYLADMHTFR